MWGCMASDGCIGRVRKSCWKNSIFLIHFIFGDLENLHILLNIKESFVTTLNINGIPWNCLLQYINVTFVILNITSKLMILFAHKDYPVHKTLK